MLLLLLLLTPLMKYVSWKNMTTSSEYQNEVFFESCYILKLGHPSSKRRRGVSTLRKVKQTPALLLVCSLTSVHEHLFDFRLLTPRKICDNLFGSIESLKNALSDMMGILCNLKSYIWIYITKHYILLN